MGTLLSTMGEVATSSASNAFAKDMGSATDAVNPIDVIRKQGLANLVPTSVSGPDKVISHGIGGFFSGSPVVKPMPTGSGSGSGAEEEDTSGSGSGSGNTRGRPSELTWGGPGRTLEPGEVEHGPNGERYESGAGRSGQRDAYDDWGNLNTGVISVKPDNTPAGEDKKPSDDGVQYLFADGGQVPTANILQQLFPDNIFAKTRDRREEEAGTAGAGITINVNSGGSKSSQPAQESGDANSMRSKQILDLVRQAVGFQNGGQVPQETKQLHSAMASAAAGNPVRSGQSDVQAGGKIRGSQSASGRDNQVIGVAGGEGILPKDVMDVPGVSDLVQNLIATFHKPVK